MTVISVTYDIANEEDKYSFAAANKAESLVSLLYEFDQKLRSVSKYDDSDITYTKADAYDEVRTLLYTFLQEHNINLDELVY